MIVEVRSPGVECYFYINLSTTSQLALSRTEHLVTTQACSFRSRRAFVNNYLRVVITIRSRSSRFRFVSWLLVDLPRLYLREMEELQNNDYDISEFLYGLQREWLMSGIMVSTLRGLSLRLCTDLYVGWSAHCTALKLTGSSRYRRRRYQRISV